MICSANRASYGVDLQSEVGNSHLCEEVISDGYDLSVSYHVGRSEGLNAELVELSESSTLRFLISEARDIVVDLGRLYFSIGLVLQECSYSR